MNKEGVGTESMKPAEHYPNQNILQFLTDLCEINLC